MRKLVASKAIKTRSKNWDEKRSSTHEYGFTETVREDEGGSSEKFQKQFWKEKTKGNPKIAARRALKLIQSVGARRKKEIIRFYPFCQRKF